MTTYNGAWYRWQQWADTCRGDLDYSGIARSLGADSPGDLYHYGTAPLRQARQPPPNCGSSETFAAAYSAHIQRHREYVHLCRVVEAVEATPENQLVLFTEMRALGL